MGLVENWGRSARGRAALRWPSFAWASLRWPARSLADFDSHGEAFGGGEDCGSETVAFGDVLVEGLQGFDAGGAFAGGGVGYSAPGEGVVCEDCAAKSKSGRGPG